MPAMACESRASRYKRVRFLAGSGRTWNPLSLRFSKNFKETMYRGLERRKVLISRLHPGYQLSDIVDEVGLRSAGQ